MWNTKQTDYGFRKRTSKNVEYIINLMQEMYNTKGEFILLGDRTEAFSKHK